MTGFLPFPEPAAKKAAPVTEGDTAPSEAEAPSGRLFLLDGNALAYRGHFALIRQPLTTSQGQNVSALYVFANTLMRVLEVEKPEYFAVAFDPKGPTFRHERYAEYKATRDKTPSELITMMPLLRKLVEGFQAPILEVPGYEADDIIGTVACQAAAKGLEVFIVTGDKDFLQIVSPKIKLYNILRQNSDVEIQGVEAAKEKFGVAPEHVVDVLALMGDSSDNVPGVAGVGPKSATDLVSRLGSVEQIYERLDEVGKPAVRKKLEASRDAAFMSKELVTLDLDAPATFDAESFRCKGPDTEKLIPLLREYEMSSLVKRLAATPRDDLRDYATISNDDELGDLLKALEAAGSFSIDVQHNDAPSRQGRLIGIAFSHAPSQASWLPLHGPETDSAARLERLKPILEDGKLEKFVHDAKEQKLWLSAANIALRGVTFDTMLGSYCSAPSEFQHDLGAIALRCLSVSRTPESNVMGTGRKRVTLDQAEPVAARDYACEAADLISRATPILKKELAALEVESLFEEVELPLAEILRKMEETGVKVDVDFLQTMSRELDARIDALTVQIHDQAGTAFNIKSPKQLGPILFEKLEIHKQLGLKKKPKRTKTGYSTDASVLQTMQEHPIVAGVLEYRGLTKLKGTYVDALPLLVDPQTGRVHTHFNQAVAATGRLSSSDPNLQNIPNRTEEGRRIRRAFVAGEEGWMLLAADYSQVELRIMAHLSEDPNMRRAFSDGQDIHRWTAGLIFGMEPQDVTPELRFRAKAINFGVIYGMGPQRLAQETAMTVKEATTFIDAYFETFSGVKNWLDRTLEQATELGFVTTLLGRRRQLPDLESSHPRIAAQARNMAVNTPIQGTAADLIKVAMINVAKKLEEAKLGARMLLQVHDELLFECPANEVAPLTELVRDTMANAMTLEVPLVVDVGVGENWLEAH